MIPSLGRLQKAIGVGPKVLSTWYIAGATNGNIDGQFPTFQLFFVVIFPLTVRKHQNTTSGEEVAKVSPMSKLPRVLLPLHEYPPYLHYGFLLTFDQITSFVHSRDPSIPITTDLGLLSIKTDRFVAKCLTEIVDLPIYLGRALNAPDTSYIIACLVDNYSIQSSMKCNKMPKEEHIRSSPRFWCHDFSC